VNTAAHCFKAGTDQSLGRALAVCSGNMDDGRQRAFRMAKSSQKPVNPVERQIDDLGMKGHHPLQDEI
jgi:hypothetical protein